MDQDALLRAADDARVFKGRAQLGRRGDVNARHVGVRIDARSPLMIGRAMFQPAFLQGRTIRSQGLSPGKT